VSVRRPHRRARLGRLSLRAAVALASAVALVSVGCASPPRQGVVHVVEPGETLWRISQRYGADLEEVIDANDIRDVTAVPAGARLWIPDPEDPSGSRPVPERRASATPPPDHDRAVREAGLAFAWPLRGSLNSRFGGRRAGPHEGIDIGAPRGTPVRAAEAGKVVYSDRLGAYGKVVILKHVGDWSTVYAHHRRNRVARGQFVEKGDLVGEVGTTGNATGPHLHFEIRNGQTPVDPLRYLP